MGDDVFERVAPTKLDVKYTFSEVFKSVRTRLALLGDIVVTVDVVVDIVFKYEIFFSNSI